MQIYKITKAFQTPQRGLPTDLKEDIAKPPNHSVWAVFRTQNINIIEEFYAKNVDWYPPPHIEI